MALKNPASSQVPLVRLRTTPVFILPESKPASVSPTRSSDPGPLVVPVHQSGPPTVEAAMRRKSALPTDETTMRALRDFHLSGDHSLQPM